MAVIASDVSLIYNTSLTDAAIDAMLSAAEALIVMHIDPLSDPLVTASVRDTIKTWLAAHFCAISDPQAKEESADGIRTVFHGKSELGLEATLYGQQAMMLDPTGKLTKLDKGVVKLNYNFSTPRSETTDT